MSYEFTGTSSQSVEPLLTMVLNSGAILNNISFKDGVWVVEFISPLLSTDQNSFFLWLMETYKFALLYNVKLKKWDLAENNPYFIVHNYSFFEAIDLYNSKNLLLAFLSFENQINKNQFVVISLYFQIKILMNFGLYLAAIDLLCKKFTLLSELSFIDELKTELFENSEKVLASKWNKNYYIRKYNSLQTNCDNPKNSAPDLRAHL